jgi:hypothetical protein
LPALAGTHCQPKQGHGDKPGDGDQTVVPKRTGGNVGSFRQHIWPEGFDANWPAVETLMRYTRDQGLIDRLFKPEELFAPNTLTEFRI